jgi:hypothetical protein
MSYNRSPPPTRQPTRRSYTRDRSSDYISRSSRPDAQYDYISGTSRISGRRHPAQPRRSHRHRERSNDRREDEDEDEDGDYIAPPRRRRSPSRADYIDPRPHRSSRKSHSRVDSGYGRYADEQYVDDQHPNDRKATCPPPHYGSPEPEKRFVRYADEQRLDGRDYARRTHNVQERDNPDVEDKPHRYTRNRSSSYTSPPPHRYSQPPRSDHDSTGDLDLASDSDVAPIRSSPQRHRRRRSPSPSPAPLPIDSDIGSESMMSASDVDYGDGIVPANHDPLAFNTRRTRRYRASDVSVCEPHVRIRGRDAEDLEELRSPSEHGRERGNSRVKRRAKRGGDAGDAGEMRRRYEAYVEDGSDASDVDNVDDSGTSASEAESEDHSDSGPLDRSTVPSSHPPARQSRGLGNDLVLRPRSPPPIDDAADPDNDSASDIVAFRRRSGVGKIGAWVSDDENEEEENAAGGARMGKHDVGTMPGSQRADAGRRARRGGERAGRKDRRGEHGGERGWGWKW